MPRLLAPTRPLARRPVVALFAVTLAACGGDHPTAPDGSATVPTVVQEFTGNYQQATVGTALASPFVVEVLNKKGEPVGGSTVTFAITAGGGSVSPASATTNSSGQARTTLTLGPASGTQTVTAAVNGLPAVTFTATATVGAVAKLTVTAGDAQTGPAGGALPAAVVVRAADALGNGVAGVTLTATAAPGSGTFTTAAATTNASGEVTGSWRLGTGTGPQRLTIAADASAGIAPVLVAATSVAGPADNVVGVTGNQQTADAGDALPTPVTVRVTDAYGNPVAGTDIAFAAMSGGAFSPASAKTDADGRASALWTLGAQAGTQLAHATIQRTANGPRVFVFQAAAQAPSPGTAWGLAHRVVDAEYNTAANTIVTVSADPARLHVIDPVAKTVQSVDLPKAPLAVSVDPAGTHAAVSHDGLVSYVNLASRTLEKTLPVSTVGGDIVLAGNGYAYVFPRADQWVDVHAVNTATGVEITSPYPGPYAGALVKLHPSGDYLYSASNGLSPSDFEKYDIRSGRAVRMYDSPYHGDYEFSGNLWITGDGTRLIARSGNVFRASTVQAEDMRYAGTLPGVRTVQAAVQLAGAPRIYVLGTAGSPPSYYTPDPVAAPDVRAYDAEFLALKGSVRLPPFKVPATGGGTTSYAAEGRFLFENTAGTRVFALVRAPGAAGLAQDWAVVVFNVSDLP